jgi:hypothetical protein
MYRKTEIVMTRVVLWTLGVGELNVVSLISAGKVMRLGSVSVLTRI